MALINITIEGDKEIHRKLERAGTDLLDMSISMKNVGGYLVEYFSTKPFASRGGVYGERWPELHPGYAEWKAENFPGRPMMVLTGELQSSFVFESGKDFVRVSNLSDHFEQHQQGIGVPKRLIMAVNQAIEKEVTSEIKADVESVIERAMR
jgi:phage gpG-like protein